ncbi:MAG: 6-phosphofructokinase [Oscillospiraceae bacterium]
MSDKLIGACIIAQSGGPTAVINASAYGAIKAAMEALEITEVYGAAYGITGVLNERLYEMGKEDPEELELLMQTPSSALGSCRYKMAEPEDNETDYARILEVFKKYNIRYFFYNGGNDSMDTCCKLSRYMEHQDWECRVIGIPKTIDNDLCGTDHCPGFGSAAKYIATSAAEIYRDLDVYENGSIVVIEVMGRHTGWLAAAASLAGLSGCAPDLIYLPERPFDIQRFTEDINDVYSKKKRCLAVVSEGIHDADGAFISQSSISENDGFGHVQLGGLAGTLTDALKRRMGAKVRFIELSLLQRCGAHLASKKDVEEAFMAGSDAVKLAVSGESGKMIGFKRTYEDGRYLCSTVAVPLEEAANAEKTIPDGWINAAGNYVTQEFIDYAVPLIEGECEIKYQYGLPRYARLKKIVKRI